MKQFSEEYLMASLAGSWAPWALVGSHEEAALSGGRAAEGHRAHGARHHRARRHGTAYTWGRVRGVNLALPEGKDDNPRPFSKGQGR